VIATGFLADRGGDRPARRSRQETARFPRASPANRADPRLLPSHTFCVGMLDLASVSTSVRSISNSVRRTHPTVSPNLRRKPPLIARRAVHHCAPLHLTDEEFQQGLDGGVIHAGMERKDIKLLKPPKEETVPPPPLTGRALVERRTIETRRQIVAVMRQLSTEEQNEYLALVRLQIDDLEEGRRQAA